jgi:transposase
MSTRTKSPTFVLELPLQVSSQRAKHLRAHFEAARCLYNALLAEAMKRLRLMRADPRWHQARSLPKTAKQERRALYAQLRGDYGFEEYALHTYATGTRTSWIADHLDSNTAQKLATRAYQAANRVCLGQASTVRFKSTGRDLDSVEGKNNTQGLRFVLQSPEEGRAGWLVWQQDRLPALIDWDDPVVKHGLDQRIKYVRLVRRRASSPKEQGADTQGYRYYAQLVLQGVPLYKPKHQVGTSTVGLDLGPSIIAIVPREGEARLLSFCSDLKADQRRKRRLQRKLDRQRRANNLQNYDERGRVKKGRLQWKDSRGYQITRRRFASQERKLAAHRKSLHGQLVHAIVRSGKTVITEQVSYKAWQKDYGRSVGTHAPGMFIERLKRTVARTGGILIEVKTRTAKLSQYCHGCRRSVKKPLSQRWHQCECGIGPVQRDLYSAFLASHLNSTTFAPSIAQQDWESAETRLRAAIEDVHQRARAGQVLPQSMGVPCAGARLPKSLASDHQELRYRHDRVEAVARWQEPTLPGRGVSEQSTGQAFCGQLLMLHDIDI